VRLSVGVAELVDVTVGVTDAVRLLLGVMETVAVIEDVAVKLLVGVFVAVAVDVKLTGDPKYDKFFADINVLYKRMKTAERALDRGPAALAKAAGLAGTTDFKAALEGVAAKLKGKVTVQIEITEKGATATIAAAGGVTLSAEEQAMVDAYKEAVIGIAEVPGALVDMTAKAVDLAKQLVSIAASAKTDFTGPKVFTILPSIISAVPRLQKILPEMKDKAPIIIEKAKNYIVTIKAVSIG
jgi:hypothetical protein